MKVIIDPRLMTTQVLRTENEEDSGLKEIVEYITHVMEDIFEETVDNKTIKKFGRIEISFTLFGGDLEDGRFHNDNVFVNVSRDLVNKLKEVCKTDLSKYKIDFTDSQNLEVGELFVRFIHR